MIQIYKTRKIGNDAVLNESRSGKCEEMSNKKIFSFVLKVEEGKTEEAEGQSWMEKETIVGVLQVWAANDEKLATLCIMISEMRE